jgi:hypothetical protein
MAIENAAEVVRNLQIAAESGLEGFDPQSLLRLLENLPIDQVMMGSVAFVLTAIPARRWTREAAKDGKVTPDEWIGIGTRAAMMATGTLMVEGAVMLDPVTAITTLTLVGAEMKLGYDLVEAIKSGELVPGRSKLKGREYWGNALKVAGKAVGAFLVVPKLGTVLFVLNPIGVAAAGVGGALVMAANYDVVGEILSGKKSHKK